MGAGGGVVGRAVILQSGEPEREQESQATYKPKEMKCAPIPLDPGGAPKDQSGASGEEEAMDCMATRNTTPVPSAEIYRVCYCTCAVSFLSLSLSR